jgi:hypothetical protein
MKGEVPAREEMEVRRVAEKEARRTDEELGRKIREAEELKRPEAEARAAKGPAQTTQNRVSQDVNRLVHLQEEKAQLLAPPSSPPTVRRINLLGTVCLLAGLLGFLGHIGGVLAPIAILLGLLLIGLNIARLGLKKMTGLHAVGPAPLPSHAYKPYPSPAAPPHRSFLSRAFSGTVGKIIFGAICGLVGGAVAAPILDFYKPEPIFAALLVGVLHGLAIGFILIPFSKILPGKIITSLVGIFIGMIVGVTIRAIIASMFGNLYWYMSASDGQAIEIMGGGILGFILGLVHGSKKTVR